MSYISYTSVVKKRVNTDLNLLNATRSQYSKRSIMKSVLQKGRTRSRNCIRISYSFCNTSFLTLGGHIQQGLQKLTWLWTVSHDPIRNPHLYCWYLLLGWFHPTEAFKSSDEGKVWSRNDCNTCNYNSMSLLQLKDPGRLQGPAHILVIHACTYLCTLS